MQKSEAAAYLAGAKQVEGAEASAPTNLHVISGEVIEKSEDGKVKVDLGGLVFSEDDEQAIEIDTLGGLEVGDTATILLAGQENRGMTPLGIGGVGTTDRVIKKIEGIEADYVKAESLEAKVAQIGFLKADSATITQLQAQTAKIESLTAEQLSAATAYIASLTANSITAESLTADVAKVHNLTADQLSAAAGYISQLTADSVTAQNISAMYGDFATVKANAAKVANLTAQELEADHATIASLDSNYAHITDGVIDNATIGYADVNNLSAHYAEIQNGHINSALINTAAIVDEQVFTVSGNKATLASIDASKINVANLHASNLIVDKLNGQPVIGGYSYISKNSSGYSSKNPKSLGWYELTASGFVKSNDTTVDPDKAYYTSGEQTKLYDQTYIDNLEQTLDDRIDGAIETFTSDAVPTLNNYPAADWTTNTERDQHIGDICYVMNEDLSQDGWCYRFAYDNTTSQHVWVLIKDSDVTAALSRLQTAEGDISGLKTFESQTTTWKNTTDNAISTIQTNHTLLEGRVDDAETAIDLKVDTSTFNEVKQTVDGNSTTITTLSEKTETLANPNLSPFYSNEFYDGTYWSSANSPYSSELGKCFTQLEDGWAHVDFDNSERTSRAYHNVYVKQPIDHIKPDTTYTFVYEVRNLSITGSGTLVIYGQDSQASDQMASHGPSATITEDGVYRVTFTSRSSFTDAMVRPVRACLSVGASTNAQLDVRASLYEGEYSGPYKPYINAYTVTTISNTVNEVKQTATSNSSTISQLTRTLGTNADGTTAEEDIVHRTSAVEQDLDTYKTTVSSTYATKTALGEEVSARETAISQIDDKISLNAKRTESLMTFVPTKHPRTDSDFWYTAPNASWVALDDGWYHLNDYTAGSSPASFYIAPKNWGQVIPGEKYTFLIEIKNYTSSDMPTSGALGYMQEMGGAQFWGNTVEKANGTLNSTYIRYEDLVAGVFTKRFVKLADVDHLSTTTYQGMCFRYRLYAASSRTTSFDIRISVYPGDYDGPYNEYLTATSSAQLMVANDEIAARVEKNGVIAAINASVEEEGGSAVKISADKVNIEGAAIFTSNGRLSQTSLDNAYDSKGAADTAKSEAISAAAEDATNKANAVQENLDNLQIGGRNLVLKTGEAKTSAASASDSSYTSNYTLSDYGHSIMNNTDDEWYCSFDYEVSGNSESNLNVYLQFRGTATAVDVTPRLSGNASGHYGESFKLTSAQASSTSKNCCFRMQHATDGATLTITNLKLEKGNKATDWSPAPEDAAADSVKRTQRIYYRKEVTGAPAAPSSWVVNYGDGSDAWTQKHISISSTDTYIYTCEQYEMADGTLGNTSILLDDTITVIDGGKILTGTVEANALKANSLTLGQISTDAQSEILNSNVQVGSRNLLQKTATLEIEDVVMARGTVQDAGVMQLTPTTSAAYFQVKTNYLDYADFGDGEYTVSCDAKLADVESTYTNTSFSLYLGYSDADNIGVAFGNNAHHKYVGLSATANQRLTDSWQRFSVTFKVPDRLTSGSLALADGVYMGAGPYVPGSRKPILVRRMKLEKGNKATDWSPAPEDQTTYVDNTVGAVQEEVTQISNDQSTMSTNINQIKTDMAGLASNDSVLALQEKTSWLRFVPDGDGRGLTIGDSDGFNIRETGERLEFNYDEQTLASASGNVFDAPNMSTSNMMIGNYAFVPMGDDGLALIYIGGE